jgi:protein O-GlcNAc transferase
MSKQNTDHHEDLSAAFKDAVEIYNQSFEDTELLTDSISKCREIMETYPNAAEPYFLLGLIAYRLGDEGQAISMCENAHKLEPEVREYAEALSVICTGVGKLADGLYFAKLVPSLESHPYISTVMPNQLKDLQGAFETASHSTHMVEALRLFNIADYTRTIKECSAEIRLNQRNFDAYILFGRTLIIVGQYHQAVNAMHAAIQIDPTSGLARSILARALVHCGHYESAIVVAENAIQASPGDAEVYTQAMSALLSCPHYDVNKIKSIAEQFKVAFDTEYEPEDPSIIEGEPNQPVHMGILSNAFFSNPHSDLFGSWFHSNRSDAIRITGYQQSVLSDSVTTSARSSCQQWREIYDVDPFTLDLTMRADELDVLVDLSGVDWISRSDIMGLNPSAVRVGAFLLPEPGLAPGVTHILCDDVLVEADDDVLLPQQQKLTVNGTLFARSPYFALLNDIPVPAEHNGHITFGGIADLARLTPECAQMWSQVLHAVPGSRLLLCGGEFAADKTKEKIYEYFSHAGTVNRIMFAEHNDEDTDAEIESVEATISNSRWKEIDIFLDTTPTNCRAALCEALWTGAPVVSLRSNQRRGLTGASILTAAKRLNWIANSVEEFVEIAQSLGSDQDKLKKERQRLQDGVSKSSLFDPLRLATEIRNALSEAGKKARS